uniref:Synaptotagmin XIVb n=2 Tax=Scophthalmus maximus TaxID=52904 RepID=A0A8D2ZJ54_SCOMX
MSRDAEAGSGASKSRPAGDAAEAEQAPGQLEWEWRDGCWRVKRTEAELAEEERKKREEQELQEKREQRRRERREKQLQKEAKCQREKEGVQEEEADERTDGGGGGRGRKASDGGERSAAQQGSGDCDGAPASPETESASSQQERPKDDGEEEEEEEKEAEAEVQVQDSAEREGGDEEEAEPPAPPSAGKKKKCDRKKGKGAKEDSKKSAKKASDRGEEEEEGERQEEQEEKERQPRSEGVPRLPRHHSSSLLLPPLSADSIQRVKEDSSPRELQPPPYQDETGPAACVSPRPRSERGGRGPPSPQHCDSPRGSSGASVDQDTESYLNKACEEDIPSDSTAVLGPEDGAAGLRFPSAYEPEPLAKYGTLDVAFEYDSGEQWLAVTVTAATDIPALKQTGNIAWQVHLVLLPTKKQRAKTGVQRGPCPVFTETFKFSRVEQEALGDYAVRFRLYSVRRMKKEKVLGEKVFYLTKLNLQGKIALPVTLEPGSELTGCGSVVSVSRSAGALSRRSTEDSSLPEILLGLVYNAATGRLSAEVIQGSHFKTTASDKPVNGLFCCIKHFVGGQLYIMRDTYVKLTMLDSKGKEMSKCKTAVCRGQPSPTYKETFVFQVALFQLSEVSLVLSVFCRRSSMKPRERLGWVSLGLNSTGEEQQTHWAEMKDAEGQQVCHWHTLSDT